MPPPELMLLASYSDWAAYEDAIYAAYLQTVARAGLVFRGDPVKVRYMQSPNARATVFGT